MRAKRKPILCQILIVFLAIMGVYLESPKIEPYFACTADERQVTYIGLPKAEICEQESCVVETLGNHSAYVAKRIAAGASTKTNTKISLNFLCTRSVSHPFSTSYSALDIVESPDLQSKTVVLYYIHNQDGKK